jgi:hypothetical protein
VLTSIHLDALLHYTYLAVRTLHLDSHKHSCTLTTVIDVIQSDPANGRGQEQGVEARYGLPPATLVEVKQCGMHEWDCGGEQCKEPTITGSEFCAVHTGVKLCKTSGITYHFQGNRWGECGVDTIHNHPLGLYPYTKRAQFCSDRCRNLWRDTKQRRERQAEVRKLEGGERSERYALLNNYGNNGASVLLDKETGRICTR